ncbi:MAG: alpha/beta hydrolase [Ruminococcaceae bacterium]|nr:alpha/beta hydrolase [Oscillospiraceae bacterium]
MIGIITHPIFLITVGILVGSGLLMWAISYLVASYCVYNCTLRRRSKDQWSREMPKDIDPEQKPMYEAGVRWSDENIGFKKDVHIVNKGLNLYGEYYDFGNERCVVILSGRTESLRYGYYFAIPYAKNGYNVLVLDPRGHGLSDGEFNTVGFEESGDAIAWVDFLKEEYNIHFVVFHGICIGAAAGMLAITSENAPESLKGIVTEGMFPNFGESMKNHLIEKKKPVFILYDLINMWMKHYTGHTMDRGPIDVIERLNAPLLMLHSREDLYSTPEFAEKLFELAGSEEKEIVWFEHGRHSMLRITDTERYDGAIENFLHRLDREIIAEKENQNVL